MYNSASDACLSSTRATKHDIAPLELAGLETLAGLEPVSFVYNEGDGRTRYGFIAEDTAEVDDQLATHDSEGQISGIDDRAVLALVVKAVQEQEARGGGPARTTVQSGGLATSTGLTLELDQVSAESDHKSAREYILEKVKLGLKPVTDFVSVRVTAIQAYFQKVHTDELCLRRTDGTEKCLKAEDFDKVIQQTPVVITPEVVTPLVAEPAPVPVPAPEPVQPDEPKPEPEIKPAPEVKSEEVVPEISTAP